MERVGDSMHGEKRHTLSRFGIAFAIPVLVSVGIGIAPSAATAEAGETAPAACIDAVDDFAAELSLEAESVDYACVDNGTVTVEGPTGETFTTHSDEVAADPGSQFCTAGDNSARMILEPHLEAMEWCVWYGRGGADWFAEYFHVSADVNLQFDAHQVSFRTLGGGSFTAELTGTVSLYAHPNPAEIRLSDVTSFRIEDSWTPRVHPSAWIGYGFVEPSAGARTMFIKIENMHITQPAEAFSIDVAFAMTGSRFACYWADDYCIWPNSQEAPFVGGAGR